MILLVHFLPHLVVSVQIDRGTNDWWHKFDWTLRLDFLLLFGYSCLHSFWQVFDVFSDEARVQTFDEVFVFIWIPFVIVLARPYTYILV